MDLSLYKTRAINDLKDMLNQSANLFGAKQAFLLRAKETGSLLSVTYSQFKQQVEMLGAALLEKGLKGKRIAVISENRYEWCLSYLSVVNGVGVVVPLDKELNSVEIKNLLIRAEVEAIFFSGKTAAKIIESLTDLPALHYLISMDLEEDCQGIIALNTLMRRGQQLYTEKNRWWKEYSEAIIDSQALAALLFTSGTTDDAKGVMLSHSNLCFDITAVLATVNVRPEDHSLSILPIHHAYECTLGFLSVLYCGASISFNDSLRNLMKNFADYKPTFFMSVPLLLENIYKKVQTKLKKDKKKAFAFKMGLLFSNIMYKVFHVDMRRKIFAEIHENLGGRVRLILVGAAAIDADICKWFENIGIMVLQGYGLTECSPLVAGNRDRAFIHGAAGVALPGVQIAINNSDENGIGEIITKGDNVMLGYLDNPEATARVLRDGWFFTGDLGKMDKKGFLTITGRSKNIIVTKTGKNIFPEELETYIYKSPFVKEAVVCAAYDAKKDDVQVSALIFPNLDTIKEALKKLTPPTSEEIHDIIDGVIKNVNNNVPVYKKIKSFTIREHEFVKTTTQKIKRHAINS